MFNRSEVTHNITYDENVPDYNEDTNANLEQEYSGYDACAAAVPRRGKGSLVSQMGKLQLFGRKKGHKIPLKRLGALSEESEAVRAFLNDEEDDKADVELQMSRVEDKRKEKRLQRCEGFDPERREQLQDQARMKAAAITGKAVDEHYPLMQQGQQLFYNIASFKRAQLQAALDLVQAGQALTATEVYGDHYHSKELDDLKRANENIWAFQHDLTTLRDIIVAHTEHIHEFRDNALILESEKLYKDLQMADDWITSQPEQCHDVEEIWNEYNTVDSIIQDIDTFGFHFHGATYSEEGGENF